MSRRPSRHTHVIFVRGCTAPPRHHATGHLVGCALFTSRTFAAVAELRLHCCCPHGYRVLSVVHVVVVIYERVLVCYRVTFSVLGISSSISVATSAPEQLAVQYSSGWNLVHCRLSSFTFARSVWFACNDGKPVVCSLVSYRVATFFSSACITAHSDAAILSTEEGTRSCHRMLLDFYRS